ncbi:starvation-inducible DNA-binding protein [Tindallia magadiensis]|uniref:Starvation-inducible DNA-binding protein n=1 Tax=Tindallia magadiensis TaxID=69895 RepID=A0A1I3A5K0_9FIRM|nr:DNA starvation/stationary phase protection protein [Tindallia magadiensis]SFH45403.1 starvation-inducible DNA-binding protein [Tindallia magadiensis]
MKDYTKMNEYLSNLAVLNIKLHNVHWNVVGPQFVQIHEYTESVYDDMFEKFDAVAELMKMRDISPLAKMSDYLKHASITELDKDKFNRDEALEIVQKDLEKMKALATDIRNEADENGDFEVVAEFEDHVAGYSKNLWFIKAMLTK